MEQLASYGIKERLATQDDVDNHVQELRLLGYTILRNTTLQRSVAEWCDRIDAVLKQQIEEAGGPEIIRRLDDENTARAILAYDPTFLELIVQPIILSICERLLGSYYILTHHNAIVNPPSNSGHYQTAYHRDIAFQHFVSSRPLSISALFCANDFTSDNGATVVLPGSHKLEEFPSDEVVRANERILEAPAGSYLVLDSMVYHRAGVNISTRPRRAINHIYAIPFFKQQIELPGALDGRFSDDPFLAKLLGYESDPPRDVHGWRKRRARRLGLGDLA